MQTACRMSVCLYVCMYVRLYVGIVRTRLAVLLCIIVGNCM